MARVVLLGDSVFDNASYVQRGPDVAAQLRRQLPEGWKVTLLAMDAASMDDIPRQLAQVPGDTTHLVLSIGGNDALRHAELLEASIGVDVLARVADAAAAFAPRYDATLAAVLQRRLPTVACTIYEGNLGGSLQKRAMGAVAVFNDRIQRAARARGVPVLELRDVFTDPEDYANPIEPSARGGAKLARAVAELLVSGHGRGVKGEG